MRKKLSLIAVLMYSASALATVNGPGQVTLGKARFTVITPILVRLEYSESSTFEDSPTLLAINRKLRDTKAIISETPEQVTIQTRSLKLVYRPNGNHFDQENLKIDVLGGESPFQWYGGQPYTHNLGGTVVTLDGAKGPVDLGYGILAKDGWSVVNDTGTPVLTDDWIRSRGMKSKPNTDWYFFGYGTDYRSALQSFTALSGKVPMPRKYVLGSWFSRYWPYSADEFKQLVAEYDQHNFPLDIMVLDMDWHEDGWTGWTWNKKLLPDAPGLMKWFHKKKLAVSLNNHPADGVGPHEDKYRKFMETMGEDPSKNLTIPFDAGNKKYMTSFFKSVHTPLEKDGVDFWWLDWQQAHFTPSVPDLFNIAWLNHLFFKDSEKTGLRGQSFSRWGGFGDHRNPIHFSGDTDTSFKMLQFEVYMTATAGNVGCFFWSHDIGGFIGSRNEEAFTRWVQFGAVSAALRLHSMRSVELDRRPWTFGPEALDSMRKSFHLRSELFPYIYSQVRRTHDESIPLIRPLYIEYPKAEEAYLHPQEYLFGDHMIAAPIVTEGKGPRKLAEQTVWFPDGIWYNWFTGESFKGPVKKTVSATLDEFPLYAKGGTPIVMQPYTSRMASTPLKHLVIRTFPRSISEALTKKFTDNETILYEDDGLTSGYEKGESASTKISYTRKDHISTLTISPTQGRFKGQEDSRSYTLEFPNSKNSSKLHITGAVGELVYNEKTHLTKIEISPTQISKAIKVEFYFDEIPASFFDENANQVRMKVNDENH